MMPQVYEYDDWGLGVGQSLNPGPWTLMMPQVYEYDGRGLGVGPSLNPGPWTLVGLMMPQVYEYNDWGLGVGQCLILSWHNATATLACMVYQCYCRCRAIHDYD